MTHGERLRVLTLIDGLGFGGAESLLGDLAAGAPSAALELHVGHLFDKDGNVAVARLSAAGVPTERVSVTGLVSPRSVASVLALVRRVRPDVVHTHLGYADLLGGIAARMARVPVVSTVHLTDWGPQDSVRDRTKSVLMSAAHRCCADRVLAVSDAARRAYLARAGGARPGRVVTVHNGIQDRSAPGQGRAVRRELGLSPDDVVLGMLSVLRPGKGHDVAADAVRILLQDHARVRLLVVGDGPARREVEQLVAGLGERVVLAGHRRDVPEVLDAVDVLLHPAMHEAFPTALLEAMSASVPVVATAVGGVPEIVEHGVTGLLVSAGTDGEELARSLAPLLEDPLRRGELGASGRARFLREFSAETWAGALRAVYEEVLAGGPVPTDRALGDVNGRADPRLA